MPAINNKYQYVISNRLGTIQTEPLGEDDFTLEWNRQADIKLDYQQLLPSKITFRNAAYQNLLKIERSIYRCEYHYITVERPCTSTGSLVWVPWFSGRFSLNDGDWYIDRCQVDIKLDEIQPGQCYDDNKDKELDFLALVAARHTVLLNDATITYQTVTYTDTTSGANNICPFSMVWGGVGDPYLNRWGVVYFRQETTIAPIPNVTTCKMVTKWVREVITVACGAPAPAAEWYLIEDLCPTGPRKYARFPRTYGCREVNETAGAVQSYTKDCHYIGDAALASIDNGMLLLDVFKFGMAQVCPALTVVSDFFQINPDFISTINYWTLQPTKTGNIVVFQKSDVKRPNVANNATKSLGTMEDIVNALCEFYNCKYRVENGIFRIEHVSYFSKNIGIDLTQPVFARAVVGKFHYTYENQRIPQREEFKTDEAGPGDFTGLPIIYSGACVTAASRSNVLPHSVDNITVDLQLVLSNPESDSKLVSDDGFVFLACTFDGTDYRLISETPILPGGGILNNSMAWAQLHRDYHKTFRPLRSGNMNGIDTVFSDPQPVKKGVPISIPLCCNDTFFPDDLIVTPLGVGTVSKASFSFKSESMELDILYPEDANLTTNLKPTAIDDNVSTFVNVPVSINVKANDTDPDGAGTLGRVVIVTQPISGTAVVQSNNNILYTPNSGFTGMDDIDYIVYDDWNEASNMAHINILVYVSTTLPVAVDDNYTAYQDTPLTVASPGLFGNDTGPGLITLQSNTTPAHGTVTINSTGGFVYTPAAGYSGPDSFTYTIINGGGLTDSATINITVLNATNPVAVDDTYQTTRNHALPIAAPGLLSNDLTSAGTLTATAGTFTTAHGGSVTIYADGHFDYTPPLDFVGTDTFNYTVSNGTGTDTGQATVIVQPTVFIRIVQTAINTGPVYGGTCANPAAATGNFIDGKFRLNFYSNSAGTIPLNVTGLGIIANYGIIALQPFGLPSVITNFTIPISGTFVDLFSAAFYRYYSYSTVCFLGGQVDDLFTNKNETIFLNAGNYTVI